MNDTERDRLLTRYLLGDLREDDADRLEERLLGEPELFETAEAVEGELLDAFARGELTPREHELFEGRLLRSERVRDRLATARALSRVARTARAEGSPASRPVVVAAEPKPSLWERLFPTSARLAWAATLVTAVAAGLFAVQNFELQDELDRMAAAERAERVTTSEETEPPTEPAEPTTPAPTPGEAPDTAVDSTERADLERALMEMDESNRELAAQLAEAREQLAAPPGRSQIDPDAQRRTRGPSDGDDRGSRDLRAREPLTRYLGQASRNGGPGDRARVILDRSTARPVLFQLQLDERPEPGTWLVAVVERGGTVIYRDTVQGYEGEGRETIALLELPQGVLFPGRHQISLATEDGRDRMYYEVEVVESP